MSFLTARASVTINASAACLAWINAFHATGQDDERPALYKTMSVELFATGVQFIATSGTIMFRTWVPTVDAEGKAHEWPENDVEPESAVVIMDGNHFALSFIKALQSAAKSFEVAELSLTVEPAPEQEEGEEPPLGAAFSEDVLTLRAFGQQLHCRLLEDKYPNWRALDFGISKAERVDGMKISTSMFTTVGKVKGVGAMDLVFTGDDSQILVSGDEGSFRGLVMPMRRKEKEKPAAEPEDDAQTDALDETTMSVNGGKPFPISNLKKATRAMGEVISGRDRAAGKDE